MTETPHESAAEQAGTNAIDVLAQSMRDFRDDMNRYNAAGTQIAARTRMIIRIVFAILSISAIYLLVLIDRMSEEMTVMTRHLEDMYGQFGTMSEDMREISRIVHTMGGDIGGIPSIASSMHGLNRDVGTMSNTIHYMNGNVNGMNNDMKAINHNMHELTGRLWNMNRSVDSMGYDVNEMSAPMNTGPLSGFWPR